jgi:phosphoribosylanthranilate isomerase
VDTDPTVPFGLIQVAGVHDIGETASLLANGVDLVGLPLGLTVNKEDLTEAEAANISKAFPGKCCLITYNDSIESISRIARYLRVNYVQLHGDLDPAILPGLREALPGTRFIKSLVVGKVPAAGLKRTLESFAPHVWAFITDTYNPETGAEGATGLTHDWRISRQLVKLSPRPVILAGGLHPQNVARAIAAVRPFGVDVHTGVEDPDGIKDPARVRKFVTTAQSAFARFPIP